jgi:hypothetical protein
VSASTAHVEQTLVAREWFSIPVVAAHRMVIEFHFAADGSGWSRYAIWGNGDVLPDILEAEWRYVVGEKQLSVTWEDGSRSEIDYELIFETRTAFARKGESTTYDAVLRVASHLFPPTSRFPDGWLKDYWGRPRATRSGSEGS